ncbi:hypothetical protein [Corynebacterium pelargi]|uniref:Uncharacterized protein n=1 Tax=Corynebacterium pelargi TaxID=1471400 RepID=A0A410WBR5_9CORY|nr:hypothetical protein [Corynebacterium pelargi]QAU53397.1 hypothetical protein CPELA_10775 [Corynebacterium pelargi]GGG72774.1 hypothetical protein GCM10007338_07380 [Corynebacterium pelargi]
MQELLILALVGGIGVPLSMPLPYRLKHCLIVAGCGLGLSAITWASVDSVPATILLTYVIFAYSFSIHWFRHRSWTRLLCDLYVVSAFPVHALMYGLNRLITSLTFGHVPLIVGDPMLVADFPATPPKHRKQ